MKPQRVGILIVAVLLAIGSFAYARHHYMSKHSATITNPLDSSESATVTNPFADKRLFGDWVKDEIIFAIIVPVALVVGGAVFAFRK